MAAKKRLSKSQAAFTSVEEFFERLDHPLKPALKAVRKIILGVSPKVSEGIKWNCPSFRTNEWFATISIRKDEVLVILHFGAKTPKSIKAQDDIRDPAGILEWLAKDRATVRFGNLSAVKERKAAFRNLVREWIKCMES